MRPALRCIALLALCVAMSSRADVEPAEWRGMLDAHNSARQTVGVAPLRWSNTLSAEAQLWASQLAAENCALRYDPDPARRESTGQNLFRASGSAPYEGYRRSPAEAAARWVQEGAQYDHGTMRCKTAGGSQCGAYLQVIWDQTNAMGCGRARCASAEVWACHYAPRGGQDGLKPYGNVALLSPALEAALPVQQCGWLGPTPAEQFGDALQDKLDPR